MPATMGSGFLKRAASRKASSCVLSPISASATTPVEMRKASKRADLIARWKAPAGAGTALLDVLFAHLAGVAVLQFAGLVAAAARSAFVAEFGLAAAVALLAFHVARGLRARLLRIEVGFGVGQVRVA